MSILPRLIARLTFRGYTTEWIDLFVSDTAADKRPTVVANRAMAVAELARRA